jgi:hypothetical protein
MWELLFWLYLINATLLINHEIDSAYWREWDLFGLPGGITLFIILHLPIVFIVLWGVQQVAAHSPAGLAMSAVLGGVGFIAFGLHSFFLIRGRPEFRSAISIALLVAILAVSAAQIYVCIRLW